MEPTIAYNPAPPVNPLEQQARILAIKNMMLENQKNQIGIQQTQALNDAYKNALTTDANGTPAFDRNKVFQSITQAGQGSILPKVQESFLTLDKLAGDVQKTKDEHNQAAMDYLGAGARMIQQSNYDPSVTGTFLAHATAAGYGKEAQQVGQAISQDPTKLKTIVDGMLAESAKQATVGKDIAQTGQSQAATQVSQAELPGAVAKSQQAQATLAGTSPTGVTADQQATLKQGQQRVGLEFQRLQEERRHNQATEGSLTPEALTMAAQQYAQTGVMPALGRTAGMRSQIMNEAARAYPKLDIATNAAAYKANEDSLKKLQSGFDQVSAFESTANKNLDLFLEQAKKVVDSGVPLINTPLRLISKQMGGVNAPAYDTARQVAVNEIAKVTSNPGLSGQLTDSARKEVSDYNPESATLAQTYHVAEILRKDMSNRHDSYAQQIADIKQRLGQSPGISSTPQSGAMEITLPSGKKITIK